MAKTPEQIGFSQESGTKIEQIIDHWHWTQDNFYPIDESLTFGVEEYKKLVNSSKDFFEKKIGDIENPNINELILEKEDISFLNEVLTKEQLLRILIRTNSRKKGELLWTEEDTEGGNLLGHQVINALVGTKKWFDFIRQHTERFIVNKEGRIVDRRFGFGNLFDIIPFQKLRDKINLDESLLVRRYLRNTREADRFSQLPEYEQKDALLGELLSTLSSSQILDLLHSISQRTTENQLKDMQDVKKRYTESGLEVQEPRVNLTKWREDYKPDLTFNLKPLEIVKLSLKGIEKVRDYFKK